MNGIWVRTNKQLTFVNHFFIVQNSNAGWYKVVAFTTSNTQFGIGECASEEAAQGILDALTEAVEAEQFVYDARGHGG